jgi:hypothetical protein
MHAMEMAGPLIVSAKVQRKSIFDLEALWYDLTPP